MEKRSHRFQDQDHNEQGEGAAQRGKGGEAGGVEQEQGVEKGQEVRKGGNGGGVAELGGAETAKRGLVACISTKISQMSPSGLLLERHSDVEKSFHKHQDVDEQREGEDGG